MSHTVNQPPMEISRLFASLNWCSGSKRVVIKEEELPQEAVDKGAKPEEYVKKTATKIFFFIKKGLNEAQKEENVETLRRFSEIVGSFADEISARDNKDVQKILKKLQKMEKKRETLTAKRVRRIYRKVIATQLHGVRKVSCLRRGGNRLLLETVVKKGAETTIWKVVNLTFKTFFKFIFCKSFRRTWREQNRASVRAFREEMDAEWGKERLGRAMRRSKVDLSRFERKGSSLSTRDVKGIMLALADFRQGDLDTTYATLQEIAKGEKDLSALPQREVGKFKKEFDVETDKALLLELRRVFPESELGASEISTEAFALLTRVVMCDDREIELCYQGSRDETLNMRHTETFLQKFFFSNHHDAKERMQMYQRIWKIHGVADKDRVYQAYLGMLSRGIVRMNLEEGQLIPAPARAGQPAEGDAEEADTHTFRYYRVGKRIVTGGGKVAYHLVPANVNNDDLPDILMYRSTASCPSFLDSWMTLVTDLNPFKNPGYFKSHLGEEEERAVYHSPFRGERKLVATGHSLGGIHAALALGKLAAKNDVPDRDIDLVTFDAPGISKGTVADFNAWAEKEENTVVGRIAIQEYFSHKDPLPGGGYGHLGNGLDLSRLKSFSCKVLDKSAHARCPEMQLHPHGRPYFQTRKGVDFTERDVKVEDYDNSKWRWRMEILRRIVGFILFPVFFTVVVVKRFFRGFEGDYAGITRIFRKIFPKRSARAIA